MNMMMVCNGRLCPICKMLALPNWKVGGQETAVACQNCGYVEERDNIKELEGKGRRIVE